MSFPLAGNGKLRLAVENLLMEQHIPHAMLIDGNPGTGRHTLTDFLSKAAVCCSDKIPCLKCRECSMAASGNHPDIIRILPEKDKKNISVNQIRQLRANAYVMPNQALRKVFILDPAESMNEYAQNALLKILEEPPESTVFILITENRSRLLPTVVSRCIIFTLTCPTQKESMEYIFSNTDCSAGDVKNALLKTDNNIGLALSLLNGTPDSPVKAAASDFFNGLMRSDQWGMLEGLRPFEKSRPDAAELIKEIKILTVSQIKSDPCGERSAALLKFYDEICQLEDMLATNINLSLLFADLTARARKYIN